MHQQEINRVNELLQELNLLLSVINETHLVTGGFSVENNSIRGVELGMIEVSNDWSEDDEL